MNEEQEKMDEIDLDDKAVPTLNDTMTEDEEDEDDRDRGLPGVAVFA